MSLRGLCLPMDRSWVNMGLALGYSLGDDVLSGLLLMDGGSRCVNCSQSFFVFCGAVAGRNFFAIVQCDLCSVCCVQLLSGGAGAAGLRLVD